MTVGKERLDTLTSLRFFAAMMIVLLHSEEVLGSLGISQRFVLTQGVAFFFVLSGFILGYNYYNLSGTNGFVSFLVARIGRIWPTYLFCAALGLAAVPGFLYSLKVSHQSVAVLAANLFMVQAWIPIREYYFSVNSLSWSVSTELFFYLSFPLIIYASARSLSKLFFSSVVFLGLILLVTSWLPIPWYNTAPGVNGAGIIYINPLARVFEFILGVIMFRLWQRGEALRQKIGSISATILEVLAVFIALATNLITLKVGVPLVAHYGNSFLGLFAQWLLHSGFPPAIGALVLVFSMQKGLISRLLKHRIFVLLGEISFSLYMVHLLLLYHLQQHYGKFLSGLPLWIVYPCFLLAAMFLAYLIFSVIETPFRKSIVGFYHRSRPVPGVAQKNAAPLVQDPLGGLIPLQAFRSQWWKILALAIIVILMVIPL